MPDQYRAFFLGKDGKIFKSEIVTASNDDEAQAQCRAFAAPDPVELWQGARRIATIETPKT